MVLWWFSLEQRQHPQSHFRASAFATSVGDRLPPRSRPRLLLRLAAEDSIDSPPRGAPARRENENTMGDGSAHPPLISQCVSLH